MAKQKGRTLLINIGSGGGTETFSPLCGLTSKTLTINNEEVDVTTPDCAAPGGTLWTEVQSGVKRLSVSGNGLIEDSAAENRLLTIAMQTEPIANFQVLVPGLGTFAGAFFVGSAEYGGEMQGGATYGLALASSGPVTFATIA